MLRARSRGFDTTPIFSSVPGTFTYYNTIPFTPLWYGGPSPLTHTLHGALRPPWALSLLCKTATTGESVDCVDKKLEIA